MILGISTEDDLWALCEKHGTRDPHIARACEEFDVKASEVTTEMRQVAKARNFAILYGGIETAIRNYLQMKGQRT